jgi:hypothetical protein
MQHGSLNAIGDTCYLKYYIIVDGKRVHKTIQLCKRAMTCMTGGTSEGSGDFPALFAVFNARRWTKSKPPRRLLKQQR